MDESIAYLVKLSWTHSTISKSCLINYLNIQHGEGLGGKSAGGKSKLFDYLELNSAELVLLSIQTSWPRLALAHATQNNTLQSELNLYGYSPARPNFLLF